MLRTLIVDDEALARRGLRHRLQSVRDVHVIGEARNGREALKVIQEHQPDLVFLDIQMPGMDGFDVLRALEPDKLPSIVFVTAFDDFAIKAFEANAVDYILKPIEGERLLDALQRVRDRQGARKARKERRSLLNLVSEIAGEPIDSVAALGDKDLDRLKKKPARLAIKDGGKTTWVKQEDIEWVDAAGDYMCVHANGETHIMRKTMKQLEQELDPKLLQRVHRSAIVNIKHVREMQSHINGEYFLTLTSGHTLKLSRTYKDKLKYFS
ncbi:LytR/AlgR family response regulator transcription factor [Elongatibacter sediminis]|uniref:Response regulator n=1 Tax=Elongatibacter sediminis TaxID=3119006 RepID=A0AAW9RGK6_9GAMM